MLERYPRIAYFIEVHAVRAIGAGVEPEYAASGAVQAERLKSGAIKCWGDNAHGGLGNRSTVTSSTPVAVSGVSNAVAMGLGGFRTTSGTRRRSP